MLIKLEALIDIAELAIKINPDFNLHFVAPRAKQDGKKDKDVYTNNFNLIYDTETKILNLTVNENEFLS